MSATIKRASGAHLWLVLWKAFDAMELYARTDVASLGLGLSDFAVLELLLHKGPMPVNTIGSKIRLTSGSISVAIDRLERRQLVERRNDPGDRRARVVHLTQKGRELIQCAFAEHAAALERAVSVLSETERIEAIRLLKKMGNQARMLVRKAEAAR